MSPNAATSVSRAFIADDTVPVAIGQCFQQTGGSACFAGAEARSLTDAAGGVEAPLNLTATVSLGRGGAVVTLRWSPAPGDQPTSYLLEAGSAPGLSNLAIVDTGSAAAGFVVQDVPPGTYYVRVRTKVGSVVGPPSADVTIVVGGAPAPPGPAPCTTPPGAPANLQAAIGPVLNGAASVTLTWTAAGGILTTYVLRAGSTSAGNNLADAEVGLTQSFVTTAPTGTYFVRVLARNTCGTSGPSNEITVVVGGGTPAPGPNPPPPPNPGDANGLFNEAVVLYNAGRFAEAKTKFEQVVSIDPGYADAYYFIGIIEVNSGNLPAARSALTTYLRLAPSGQYAETARRILGTIP